MKLAVIIATLILLISGSIIIVGLTAYEPYEATLMTVVNKSQKEVYSIITNIWLFPLMFDQAVKVELLSNNSKGYMKWVEYDIRNIPWIYEISDINDSNQIVISIISNKMYEYGHWYIEVNGNTNTSYISIREKSKFKNWWYQLRGLLYGRNKGLKMKIDSINQHFNEEY